METRGKILLVDSAAISPQRDAGSRAVLDLATVLAEIGFEIEFLWESTPDFKNKLATTDASQVWISRPMLFNRIHWLLDNRVKIVYLAHDLHTLRVKRELKAKGKHRFWSIKAIEFREKRAFSRSTLALLPTLDEAAFVRETWGIQHAHQVNYFYFDSPKVLEKTGQQLVFVGGEGHSPNFYGIRWFILRILPQLQKSFTDLELLIIGPWSEESIAEFSSVKGVKFTGPISEEMLGRLLDESVIGLAPLQFGAGIKRKVLDYLNHGLPVVSTRIGLEGIEGPVGTTPGSLVAESEVDWIRQVTKIINDRELRKNLAEAGSAYINLNYSKKVLGDRLLELLADI